MFHEYHAQQDGADFYLNEGSALIAVVTYPDGVRDFDMNAAVKAREWFTKLMRSWNVAVYFTKES